MNAKLFVKGMKEPIELEHEEALAAQALIGDPAKSDDTIFSIEGVWSGKKREMRFVVFDKKEQGSYSAKEVIAMTKEEAEKHEAEVKPYEQTAIENGFKPFCAFEFFMQAKGAIVLDIFSMPTAPEFKSFQVKIRDLDAYRILCAERERYLKYRSRVEYAKKKDLEGLDALAEQMSV